jgi:hypothetical protein
MAGQGVGRWLRLFDASPVGPLAVEVTDGECPNCGAGTPLLARTCSQCGGQLALRMAGLLVAGALVLLAVAIVIALVVLLRWHQLAAATESGDAADEQIATISTDDLSWLASAMSGCDAEAKTNQGVLHFLVTPLVSVAKDLAPWQAKSINDAGNGILLRADDTLAGLKSGELRIYPADYGFSIFDEAGNTIQKWRPATGVAKFSAATAGPISTFKVQFRTAHSDSDPNWGGSFNRLNGSCYWVNAIIDN